MQPLRSFFPQFSLEDLHQQIKADTGKGPLGRQAAIAVGYGRSIGIRLNDGNFWRFLATEDGIDIDKRIDSAKVIIDADSETWHDLVSEAWSIMGLILQNKVRIEKGNFQHVAAWEAPLQALYNKRRIFMEEDLSEDLPHEFKFGDNPNEMANSLNSLGFILVRDVFTQEEINAMSTEVDQRRKSATPEDKRSWWATDSEGDEHCCRVTYLNHGSDRFAQLAHDSRLAELADLSEDRLYPTPNHGDGISAVIKVPDIQEGLADLPWHRDCGMGGHPLICPGLNIGIQLDVADAESGQLIFLPGSNGFSGGANVANKTRKTVGVIAEPGDVTVHYGHTLHVAPPPTGTHRQRRTIYVSFHKAEYINALPEGKGYNDVLFAHGDGRVRTPQERITES